MKKNLILMVVLVFLSITFTLLFVSAKVVATDATEWYDTDIDVSNEDDVGLNINTAGMVYDETTLGENRDECVSQGNSIKEYYIRTFTEMTCTRRGFIFCWNWEDVEYVEVDSVTSACDYGCESVSFLAPGGFSFTAGQCMAPQVNECFNGVDGGNDDKVAGITSLVKGSLESPVYEFKPDEKISDKKIREYYCLGSEITYEDVTCSGKIESTTIVLTAADLDITDPAKSAGAVGVSKTAYFCHEYDNACSENAAGTVDATDNKNEPVWFPHGHSNNLREPIDSCINSDPRSDQLADEIWEVENDLAIHAGVDSGSHIIDYTCDVSTDTPIYSVSLCENGCVTEGGSPKCIGVTCGDTDSDTARARVIWDEAERNSQMATRGTVTASLGSGKSFSGQDVCLGDDILLEYWCPTADTSFVLARAFNCDTGKVCRIGACVAA